MKHLRMKPKKRVLRKKAHGLYFLADKPWNENKAVSQPIPKIVTDSLQKQFNKLGKALDSGNLPAAQVAYQSIQKINKKATVRMMQATPTPKICRFE